jgi:predicted PurR-regulated permease PerM
MKKVLTLLVVVAAIFLFTQTGWTQTSEELQPIIDEIKSLKKGQQSIQKELQDIKKALQAKPAQAQRQEQFKEAVIDITGNPFKGEKTAKVTILEFSDYQ